MIGESPDTFLPQSLARWEELEPSAAVAMGFTGKLLFPLLGAVLLCGVVLASESAYDDVNSLPTEEKRRIIRELLRAQRDIRSALLKIHYSLNGEELDADGSEDPYWQGCWDKDLAGYRTEVEGKMSALTDALQQAHQMIDELNDRIKYNWYGPHKPGGGFGGGYGEYGPGPGGYGPEYGHGGYESGGYGGPGPFPTRPPLTTTPETTSWRPTTEPAPYVPEGDDDDDDYYARRRPGHRRYGRELEVNGGEATKVEPNEDKPVDPIEESAVAEALDQLVEEKP
uniref:Uncharacterized protein n=1 Tax=Anopheles farauti TaxID=69004 RepID=A0A182QK26_9DIPT